MILLELLKALFMRNDISLTANLLKTKLGVRQISHSENLRKPIDVTGLIESSQQARYTCMQISCMPTNKYCCSRSM